MSVLITECIKAEKVPKTDQRTDIINQKFSGKYNPYAPPQTSLPQTAPPQTSSGYRVRLATTDVIRPVIQSVILLR